MERLIQNLVVQGQNHKRLPFGMHTVLAVNGQNEHSTTRDRTFSREKELSPLEYSGIGHHEAKGGVVHKEHYPILRCRGTMGGNLVFCGIPFELYPFIGEKKNGLLVAARYIAEKCNDKTRA